MIAESLITVLSRFSRACLFTLSTRRIMMISIDHAVERHFPAPSLHTDVEPMDAEGGNTLLAPIEVSCHGDV